jgi:hypothetical protein
MGQGKRRNGLGCDRGVKKGGDMDLKNHRIVLLEQVPPDERETLLYCFYCRSCPYHGKKVKAVAAVEILYPSNRIFYSGICGNHAEAYPRTEEDDVERKPLLCPHCFNRDGTRREQH